MIRRPATSAIVSCWRVSKRLCADRGAAISNSAPQSSVRMGHLASVVCSNAGADPVTACGEWIGYTEAQVFDMAKKRSGGKPLARRVALVAGATRGAGRGIARALGEAGATVYCTGRSVTGHPSPYNRPETIDETGAMIAAAGGTAIAVRVDHTVESEVQALFKRIDAKHGRLDILVNSI